MKATSEAPKSARDRILGTAQRLFYREGLQAVGIDRIIEEAGVAKMTFYRHFPSKNDLIATFLRERHRNWMESLTKDVEARQAKSGGGIEVYADILADWFREPDFIGCAFINSASEVHNYDSEVMKIAGTHATDMLQFLENQLAREGVADAKAGAEEAFLVIEGAIVRAHMSHDPTAAEVCRRLLRKIAGR
jgi:AcrR family transcriptional regulator